MTVEPTPPVAADPAPAADPLAPTTEPSAAETPVTTEASEPAAAAKPVKRATRSTAAKPATTARSVPTRSVAASPAPAPAPVAAPAQTAASESAVPPVVDMNAEQPKPAAPVAAEAPDKNDDMLPIAAGGALGLLALGGAAFAMTRRRRRQEEEEVWVEEEPVEQIAEPAPVVAQHDAIAAEQPLIVAPSAFGWGNERAATVAPASTEPLVEEDDRRPGESWVERAHRGPTPNNPSVSLRNRLRRAAFFDQRERDVAAGRAEPVAMSAGLPDAMVEEQERDRELA